MDPKEVAYLIMQDMYIKKMGYSDDYTEEDIIRDGYKLFPDNWFLTSYEYRNDLISRAIKENKNLRRIVDEQ